MTRGKKFGRFIFALELLCFSIWLSACKPNTSSETKVNGLTNAISALDPRITSVASTLTNNEASPLNENRDTRSSAFVTPPADISENPSLPQPAPARDDVGADATGSTTPGDSQKSPNQDLARELYNRGVQFIYGDGVARDFQQAITYFKQAAEMGHPAAQHNLGVLLLKGDGIKADPTQARSWFLKSAEQGVAEAQFKVASMYATGQGGPKDLAEALNWARKAAEQGHIEGQYNLATLYASGLGVEKDMDQAAEWFRKAAEKGHPIAQSNLGALYASGQGVPKDLKEAVKWFRLAADKGNPAAQFNLARSLSEGSGTDQNLVEAYKWFSLAAEQGDPESVRQKEELANHMSAAQIGEAIRRANSFTFQKIREIDAARSSAAKRARAAQRSKLLEQTAD